MPTGLPTGLRTLLPTPLSAVLLALVLALPAVGSAQADPTDATSTETRVEVPELPFDDNPDPDQCGIPQPLGDDVRGTVDGRWEGETLFPDVHLYDSHLRSRVTGTIPTGTRVTVEMFQNNPVLNYWYVRWNGPGGTVEGWIPGPFLTVER
ncbi:MAG: hypothetical protein U5J97_03130 [Trueperaceae bacterium]|nr:hypothetical protein [Trueperaceae bacterium]